MKLLLTSNGLTNQPLVDALRNLVGKPFGETKLAYIITASNVEDEDKGWLIDDLVRFKDLGLAKIDLMDIASIEEWESRLEEMNVLVFGGGSTAYLVKIIKKIGLDKKMPEWLTTKVLVGISAGSVMCGPIINPKNEEGLSLVDFIVVPHMGSSFSKRSYEDVKGFADSIDKKIYWLDDDSAIQVNDGVVKTVGSGKVEQFN